jgi:hypothetical protein
MAAALEALSRVLHGAFPGWVIGVESDQIYSAIRDDYQVWVSKTVLRNHPDVLDRINASRMSPGTVREWVRNGYIVAADYSMPMIEDAVVTRVDVYKHTK